MTEAILHANGADALGQLGAAGHRGWGIVGMPQLVDVHGFDFVFRPSQEPGPGRIDVDEIALEISDAEQILGDIPDTVALEGSRFDFRFQFFLELTQLLLGELARVFGLDALHGEAEPARKVERKVYLLAWERCAAPRSRS